MRIILIGGGWSPEREISLKGCRAIKDTLEEMGHSVIFLDPLTDMHKILEEAKIADFAFLNLHGSPGEDGLIQAILDNLGCPYQGSDTHGSLLALNKSVSKAIFKDHNIPTPRWEFVPYMPDEDWDTCLNYPIFVKPNCGGSSINIKIVNNKKNLLNAIKDTLDMGEPPILEEEIKGEEVTCAILGDSPLPPVLIKPKANFFDYTSKYSKDGAEEICPAPISQQLTQKVQKLALKCHKILGLMDYSRVDFIINGDIPYVLEVNTLPGMTERSLLPLAARQYGYNFKELLYELINLGLRKKRKKVVYND